MRLNPVPANNFTFLSSAKDIPAVIFGINPVRTRRFQKPFDVLQIGFRSKRGIVNKFFETAPRKTFGRLRPIIVGLEHGDVDIFYIFEIGSNQSGFSFFPTREERGIG